MATAAKVVLGGIFSHMTGPQAGPPLSSNQHQHIFLSTLLYVIVFTPVKFAPDIHVPFCKVMPNKQCHNQF